MSFSNIFENRSTNFSLHPLAKCDQLDPLLDQPLHSCASPNFITTFGFRTLFLLFFDILGSFVFSFGIFYFCFGLTSRPNRLLLSFPKRLTTDFTAFIHTICTCAGPALSSFGRCISFECFRLLYDFYTFHRVFILLYACLYAFYALLSLRRSPSTPFMFAKDTSVCKETNKRTRLLFSLTRNHANQRSRLFDRQMTPQDAFCLPQSSQSSKDAGPFG